MELTSGPFWEAKAEVGFADWKADAARVWNYEWSASMSSTFCAGRAKSYLNIAQRGADTSSDGSGEHSERGVGEL